MNRQETLWNNTVLNFWKPNSQPRGQLSQIYRERVGDLRGGCCSMGMGQASSLMARPPVPPGRLHNALYEADKRGSQSRHLQSGGGGGSSRVAMAVANESGLIFGRALAGLLADLLQMAQREKGGA